jgi:hypothetical protein
MFFFNYFVSEVWNLKGATQLPEQKLPNRFLYEYCSMLGL